MKKRLSIRERERGGSLLAPIGRLVVGRHCWWWRHQFRWRQCRRMAASDVVAVRTCEQQSIHQSINQSINQSVSNDSNWQRRRTSDAVGKGRTKGRKRRRFLLMSSFIDLFMISKIIQKFVLWWPVLAVVTYIIIGIAIATTTTTTLLWGVVAHC